MATPEPKKHVASAVIHAWSAEALFAKAQRYADEMLKHPRDDWRFGLWSALALELLGRAALAKFNPALLADGRDWNNIYYSLGFSPTANKFIPKSVDINEVFKRLREMIPRFTTELEGFAVLHMARRNEDVHSGGLPFDNLKTAGWLPTYYFACTVLIEFLGGNLELLVGAEESVLANTMIAASQDQSAKAVMKSVNAYRTVWDAKDEEERAKLSTQAQTWALRGLGHRVTCPACGSVAIVTGEAIAAPFRELDGDLVVETQQYLPSKFECVACQLKIAGLSQLSVCGVGDTYKATFTYDLAEYYTPEVDYSDFEDDNNEP